MPVQLFLFELLAKVDSEAGAGALPRCRNSPTIYLCVLLGASRSTDIPGDYLNIIIV